MSSYGEKRLLVVRHAIAEERVEFARTGKSDFYRPLTERGRERMMRSAAGLRSIVPELDVLASSPLTRALETADVLAEEYGDMPIEQVESLGSGDSHRFLRWLQDTVRPGTTAIVGHEPMLGEWTSWLLSGGMSDFVLFKKGAACLLEFPSVVRPGGAYLAWALAPAQLRRLRR